MLCVHVALHLYIMYVCMPPFFVLQLYFIFQRIVVHIIVADFLEGCTHYLVSAEYAVYSFNLFYLKEN